MIYAGLDVATRTGVGIFDVDACVHASTFKPKGESDAEIFHGFREWLWPLLVSHGVEHVAIEEPLRTDLRRKKDDGTDEAVTTMRVYLRLYGLRAHALEVCHALGIECHEVHQATWRKAFLGNGHADKDDAMAQCKLLRWPVTSKDAAEACGVAWWLAGQLRLGRHADLFTRGAA